MKLSQSVSELQSQTRGSTLGWSQFTKGNNSLKVENGVTVLKFYTTSDRALYLYQVSRKYLKRFHRYSADMICILNFKKGHSSVKTVARVKVLHLCTTPDNALYLYQVLSKYVKGFQCYTPGQ